MGRGRKIFLIAGMSIVGVIVVAAIAAFLWLSDAAAPMPEALDALVSDDQVTVTTEPWLIFEPASTTPESGFIFYPGGKVDPRAYAPAAHAIAEAGHLAVIVPMPYNLAVLAPNRANQVIDAFPAIQRWTLGGHSLGGTMAASYVGNHPEQIDNLTLWASYPTDSASLAARDDLRVVSIYGTLDGLVSLDDIDGSRSLLPSDTVWTPIEGGNHAQFGWYGPQEGDNPATITRVAQQAEAIAATLALLVSGP